MINLDAKKKFLLIVVGVSIIIGVTAVGILKINPSEDSLAISEGGKKAQQLTKDEMDEKTEIKAPNKNTIFVHVTGAVEKPNMYKLDEGSRIYDVVMLAKPKKDADLDQVNLAEKLRDQMKINVPRKGEVINADSQDSINTSTLNNTAVGNSNSTKINLNTATEMQIQGLEGIGPALAKRIIDYRQAKGGFHSINDLKNVSGIGEKKFAKLKNQVTI